MGISKSWLPLLLEDCFVGKFSLRKIHNLSRDKLLHFPYLFPFQFRALHTVHYSKLCGHTIVRVFEGREIEGSSVVSTSL